VEWNEALSGRRTLMIVGRNLERHSGAYMKLTAGPWLSLRVKGAEWHDAVMSAVTSAGETMIHYRFERSTRWSSPSRALRYIWSGRRSVPVEIVVDPAIVPNEQLILAIMVSADELRPCSENCCMSMGK